MKDHQISRRRVARKHHLDEQDPLLKQTPQSTPEQPPLVSLQRVIGNRAVSRLSDGAAGNRLTPLLGGSSSQLQRELVKQTAPPHIQRTYSPQNGKDFLSLISHYRIITSQLLETKISTDYIKGLERSKEKLQTLQNYHYSGLGYFRAAMTKLVTELDNLASTFSPQIARVRKAIKKADAYQAKHQGKHDRMVKFYSKPIIRGFYDKDPNC